MIAEAEAALKRASALDPKEPRLIMARIRIAVAKAVPLAEYDAFILDGLAQAEGKDAVMFTLANRIYCGLLQAVGRWREALPYDSASVANDPAAGRGNLATIYAVLGQSSRARDEYEQAFALNPTAATWSAWTSAATFLGAGDGGALLKFQPSFVRKSVADCFRDISKAYVSKDPRHTYPWSSSEDAWRRPKAVRRSDHHSGG